MKSWNMSKSENCMMDSNECCLILKGSLRLYYKEEISRTAENEDNWGQRHSTLGRALLCMWLAQL